MSRATTPVSEDAYRRERAFAIAMAKVLQAMFVGQRSRSASPSPDTATLQSSPDSDLQWAESVTAAIQQSEQQGLGTAKRAVRLAVQDSLEATRDLSPEAVRRLDQWLGSAGLPTLSWMRAEIWKTVPKVIARERIRNEVEYYLVIERVNDVHSGLSEHERDVLSSALLDFEQRRKPKV